MVVVGPTCKTDGCSPGPAQVPAPWNQSWVLSKGNIFFIMNSDPTHKKLNVDLLKDTGVDIFFWNLGDKYMNTFHFPDWREL